MPNEAKEKFNRLQILILLLPITLQVILLQYQYAGIAIPISLYSE